MEKIIVEQTAIVLGKREKERIIALLRYCKHRFQYHPDCGIQDCGADIKFVDYLLANL